MSYTPINWDEYTPITATNLDIMDSGIDNNEGDLRTIQGGETEVDGRITINENNISNNDGRITDVEDGTTLTNANQYKGNDIDSNGDGIVDNADNVTSTYKGNDIDTDGDGKVDEAEQADNASIADYANDADASTYKNNDIDTNGDGKVDEAENADKLGNENPDYYDQISIHSVYKIDLNASSSYVIYDANWQFNALLPVVTGYSNINPVDAQIRFEYVVKDDLDFGAGIKVINDGSGDITELEITIYEILI